MKTEFLHKALNQTKEMLASELENAGDRRRQIIESIVATLDSIGVEDIPNLRKDAKKGEVAEVLSRLVLDKDAMQNKNVPKKQRTHDLAVMLMHGNMTERAIEASFPEGDGLEETVIENLASMIRRNIKFE